MLDACTLPALLLIFAATASAVWIAGIRLSRATDVIARRLGLGEALGGLILLAFVTNLPEIAIVFSGALRGDLSLAVGNILGGIAIQTVVLVVLDVFGLGRRSSLTHAAGSLSLVLEAVMVLAILAVVLIGSQLPAELIFARVTPDGLLILLSWVAGLWLVNKSRRGLPWQLNEGGPRQGASDGPETGSGFSRQGGRKAAWVFVIGALVTLGCGVLLERCGDIIAARLGMEGVVFGATILAIATSLPEISTGLASIKLKDYEMAVSDILGGNAFLPVLFLPATLLSGSAVLPLAHRTDLYLTGLGMLLTCVYLAGLIFRSKRQVAGMGIDSCLVLLLYLLGVAGLFLVRN